MNTLVFDTSTFMTLSQEELMEIEAGANWDRVFGGTSVYLGATMAVLMTSTPIGWGQQQLILLHVQHQELM